MYSGMTARDNLGLIATQLHYLYCEARVARQPSPTMADVRALEYAVDRLTTEQSEIVYRMWDAVRRWLLVDLDVHRRRDPREWQTQLLLELCTAIQGDQT